MDCPRGMFNYFVSPLEWIQSIVISVCHTVCLFVCLSVCLSFRLHNLKTTEPNFTKFLCMLLMVSTDGVARRGVFPVLWMKFGT